MSFLSEIKRRNVHRMAALYAVAAWLVMQLTEVMMALADLPDGTGEVVLALLAIGFPIALLFSWFYELTPEGLALEKDVEPGKSITHITGRRLDFIVIAVLAAALILFAWDKWWRTSPSSVAGIEVTAIESVAVLPLTNLSDDPAQKYFVEGMQDAIITRLSRTTDLRVISKTSTLRYENTDKPIPNIARELNVDALIEGSVLRDADRIRITAKLIRGAEDEHLWAMSYDRDLEHVLPLINEIAIAVADAIHVTVKRRDATDMTLPAPVSTQVHELVLQGHHYFDRFRFEESLDHYQRAAELEPGFAAAHAGVAGSYLLIAFFDWSSKSHLIPLAREAALKAISLDENSAGGYSTLGAVQLYVDWDWESARRNLLRALELSPNDSRTRHAYADYLMVTGDLEESLNQVEIGLLYDPLSPMARHVVEFHRILARQYDEVIDNARRAIAQQPGSSSDRAYYREALWLAGMHEEALAEYRRRWGADEAILRAMNTGFAEAGYAGAIGALADMLAERHPVFDDPLVLAALYARAGEPDRTLEWLERAYERRHPQILHVKAMPVFDELRSDPRFQDLLRRVGFPDASQEDG